MNLYELLKDVCRNQRLLMLTGLACFILFIILVIGSFFDSQQILGINRWIKPVKFAVSGAVFLWTAAIYLYYLRDYKTSARVIASGTAFAIIGEIILIVMQSARGKTSHFNFTTSFDSAIFGLMGLLILFNTILIVYLTYLYFRAETDLPKALIWGMRLGLIVFLIGSIQGGYMSGQTGHTVGLADGGAGLPIVNWSTGGGDLRIAHFVGLHGLQAIPLFALFIVILQNRFSPFSPRHATALTIVFAVLYVASFTLVHLQAVRGKPLFGKQIIVAESLP
ncbi:MAG TPA: hypothetical protein VF596_19855 [Pyrinomonadaceae bacterium]|jgi:hypothetical protein